MRSGTAALLLASAVPSALTCGCVAHRVNTAPIEIKPIHITMDINLRVQRELDEFFDFEKTAAPENPTPEPRRKDQ